MIATRVRALFCLFLAAFTLGLAASTPTWGAGKKRDTWVEVRSPHFVVVSNAGEKKARRAAGDFERIRAVFLSALLNVRENDSEPIVVLAVKNEDGLKELLPQYWEREGPRPGGVFQRGFDKHFITVRLDGRSHQRYRLIYHEYFHLLTSQNLERIPVWMNEGLAEFWERTAIRGKTVEMGIPTGYELLHRNRMLALEELFGMEENPHDADPEKVSIFYAQSWALVHYIMVGDEAGTAKAAASEYLKLVQENVDSVEAARRTFGDLEDLEKTLKKYVRSSRLRLLRMDAPDKIDEKAYPVRRLSPADSAAVRGSFLATGHRPDAAQPLLEEALRLDPKNALAHESMGYLHFRRDQRDTARRWFAAAVDLGSRSYISHYYYAVLATGSVEDAEAWAKAERSLKRAVELNPTFGPGYGQLAYEYLRREQNLEEALGIARRAVELEPNNMTYLVNAAEISLRLNRPDEARVVAERIAAVAATEDERTMATAYLEGLQHYARPTKLSNTIHYDAKGADLEPWIHKMVTEVQSVWRIPPSDTFEAGHVAVEAFMSRSGEILSLRIKASSGDREFDSAAEQALRQAVLSALPEDYPENVFEFVLVFWYNQKPTT